MLLCSIIGDDPLIILVTALIKAVVARPMDNGKV